jgi:hypothetical protein
MGMEEECCICMDRTQQVVTGCGHAFCEQCLGDLFTHGQGTEGQLQMEAACPL